MILLKSSCASPSRTSLDRSSLFEPLSPIASSSESNTSRSSSQHNSQPASAEEHSKARDERLCKLFELEDEHFKDYFLCAYTAKNGWFLVQGLLYVFERHVCFFSNLFGIETVKVIPLEQVRQVCKTKHLGLPNSITVYHTDETATTFTSFLSRRAAHDSINESLQNCRSTPEPVSSAARPPTGRKTKVSVWGRHWERTSNLPRVASIGKLKRTRSIDNALAMHPYDQDAVWAAVVDAVGPSARQGRGNHRRNNSRGSRGSSLVRGVGEEGASEVPEAEEWEDDVSLRALTPDQGLELQASPFAEVSAQSKILAAASVEEPPPVPEGNTPLLDFTIEGLSPLQVAEALLAEGQEDSIFVTFHNANGHRKAQHSEEGWQAGDRVSEQLQGWVRDFEFETKKLGKWTRCVQQQHFCAYLGGATLVFATQQKMPDLSMFPMGKVGDQFSVETQWRLSTQPSTAATTSSSSSSTPPPPSPPRTPAPAATTHISISGTVRFFSHASAALPRGVITSTAVAELKDWLTRMLPFIEERARHTAATASLSASPRPRPILPPSSHSAPTPSPHRASGPDAAPAAFPPPHACSTPLPHSPAIFQSRAAPPAPITIPPTPSAPAPPSTSLRTPLPALWPSDDPAPTPAATKTPATTSAGSQLRSRQYSSTNLQHTQLTSARSVASKVANQVLRSHKGGLAGLGRLAAWLLLALVQVLLLHMVWRLSARVQALEARLGAL